MKENKIKRATFDATLLKTTAQQIKDALGRLEYYQSKDKFTDVDYWRRTIKGYLMSVARLSKEIETLIDD